MLSRWLRRERDEDRVVAFAVSGGSALVVRQGRRYRDLVEVADREMVHTRVLVDDPSCSGFAYTDAMHAAVRLARRRSSEVEALCLGGGGGVVARQLEATGARVDVVEASAAVIELASTYFGLRESASLAIHHADAADFVARSQAERYDVVLVDLFGASEASPLLARPAFFEAVKRCLRDGGALAVNTIGALDGDAGAMLAVQYAIRASFPHDLSLAMLSSEERASSRVALRAPRNIVTFATHGPLPSQLPIAPTPANLPALPSALHDIDTRLRALDIARARAAASTLGT